MGVDIWKLLVTLANAPILDQRLAMAKDLFEAVSKENEALKQRVREAEAEASEAKDELLAKSMAEQYVEHHGALFKPLPGGGYHECVYCPRCHGPMSSLGGHIPFRCGLCACSVNFCGKELQRVMATLPPRPKPE